MSYEALFYGKLHLHHQAKDKMLDPTTHNSSLLNDWSNFQNVFQPSFCNTEFFFFLFKLSFCFFIYSCSYLLLQRQKTYCFFLQTYYKKQIIYYFGKSLSSGYPLWFHTKCLFIVFVGLLKNNWCANTCYMCTI